MTNLDLIIPELNHTAEIYAKCHLTDKLKNYNLICNQGKLPSQTSS